MRQWPHEQDSIRKTLFDEKGHLKDDTPEKWQPFKDLVKGACRTREARQEAASSSAATSAGDLSSSSSLFAPPSKPEAAKDPAPKRPPAPGGVN